jgi:predicted nucleotidyltransferase
MFATSPGARQTPGMTPAVLPIALDADKIAEFCRERGIRRLALFGSVLRDDFTSASDVDMLVEYLPGRHPGLMLFRQQEELASQLHRAVDLHTPASLSRHFRDEVQAASLAIYEQA